MTKAQIAGSTRPFGTATPDTAMKPTAAETENGMARIAMREDPSG
ncbi:MAG: hypothetical protein ABI885_25390 [Gammaproteobacteria bacterium]